MPNARPGLCLDRSDEMAKETGWKCPDCGKDNEAKNTNCVECQAPIPAGLCPACGYENESGVDFCAKQGCGHNLKADPVTGEVSEAVWPRGVTPASETPSQGFEGFGAPNGAVKGAEDYM